MMYRTHIDKHSSAGGLVKFELVQCSSFTHVIGDMAGREHITVAAYHLRAIKLKNSNVTWLKA